MASKLLGPLLVHIQSKIRVISQVDSWVEHVEEMSLLP